MMLPDVQLDVLLVISCLRFMVAGCAASCAEAAALSSAETLAVAAVQIYKAWL
jgi:hypothetical protein